MYLYTLYKDILVLINHINHYGKEKQNK